MPSRVVGHLGRVKSSCPDTSTWGRKGLLLLLLLLLLDGPPYSETIPIPTNTYHIHTLLHTLLHGYTTCQPRHLGHTTPRSHDAKGIGMICSLGLGRNVGYDMLAGSWGGIINACTYERTQRIPIQSATLQLLPNNRCGVLGS